MLKQLTILASFALTSVPLFAQPQQLRGTVTDAMCGRKHMMKNASAAECTRACVKAGSDFALAVGDKLYTLKGEKARIDKFAGANVVVTGDVEGSIVTVKDIKPAM
jgi:hypothetical protein